MWDRELFYIESAGSSNCNQLIKSICTFFRIQYPTLANFQFGTLFSPREDDMAEFLSKLFEDFLSKLTSAAENELRLLLGVEKEKQKLGSNM